MIDFLKKTFGAAALRRLDGPDGNILHVEVRVRDIVVRIADAGGAYPAFAVWLRVLVPDGDETYRKALAAGGISVQEPVGKVGDRMSVAREGSVREYMVDLDIA